MKTFQQQTVLFGLLIAFQLQTLYAAVLPGGSGPAGAFGDALNGASGSGAGGAASGVSSIVSGIGGAGSGADGAPSAVSNLLPGGSGGLPGLTSALSLISALGGNNQLGQLLAPLQAVFGNADTPLDQLLKVVQQLLEKIEDLLEQLVNTLEGVLPPPLNNLPLSNLPVLQQALDTLDKLNLDGITVGDLCDPATLVQKVLNNNEGAFQTLDQLAAALQALSSLAKLGAVAGNACTAPGAGVPPVAIPPAGVPPVAVPPAGVPPVAIPPVAVPPAGVPPVAQGAAAPPVNVPAPLP